MNLDTYIKMRYFISASAGLIESCDIRVNDTQALALYNQLFVLPDMNFEFPQMP